MYKYIVAKGTDIGIKLLPVTWVCLCMPRHIHCSRSAVGAQVHNVMHTCVAACSLLFFYNPYNIMSPVNSKNFSFTCYNNNVCGNALLSQYYIAAKYYNFLVTNH